MKLSTTAIITALSAGLANAVESQDVAFLTALVSDFSANKKEYLNFLATASFPGEITSLAKEVGTYTDDSYTTLLKDSSLDILSLESYATNFPWYTRLASEAHFTMSGALDNSASEAASVSVSASETSSGSKSSASSSSSSSSASSSSASNAGGSLLYCSSGAVLGALALALF